LGWDTVLSFKNRHTSGGLYASLKSEKCFGVQLQTLRRTGEYASACKKKLFREFSVTFRREVQKHLDVQAKNVKTFEPERLGVSMQV